MDRQRRTPVLLALRFGNAAAKIIQQREKFFLLGRLRGVVRAPILRVGLARLAHGERLGDGCRAIGMTFTLNDVLDREDMLALEAAFFMVRATAMRFGRV